MLPNIYLATLRTVLKHLLNGSNIVVIYLDFSKIFDKLGEWLHNFLKVRHQAELANRAISKELQTTSGVPQGTILELLLMLTFSGMLWGTRSDNRP